MVAGMVSKTEWLDAGLRILAEHGSPALTIERLTDALSLSKGSFYHHFGGVSGYRTALLAYIEAKSTTRIIDAVESADSPEQKLARLSELVLSESTDPTLEIAVRAWAQQDPEVREVQARMDRTRVEYLRDLMRAAGREADLGDLIYLVLIGANHVLPPVDADRLRAMWALILR